MSVESITNAVLKNAHDGIQQEIISEVENDFHVSVLGSQKQLCVGIIDIVNSTKTVATLPQNKYSNYYEIFLNHIGRIIFEFEGKILKTLGDGILFYYPKTSDHKKLSNFLDVLNSGVSMITSHPKLRQCLVAEFLPSIDFRISLDYGQVTMMKTSDWILDLLGPTINTCAKINRCCKPNNMVIGEELFQYVKPISEFKFKKIDAISSGVKFEYPVYSVTRNKSL